MNYEKSETAFRNRDVRPFLKKLKNTVAFPIQQVGIKGDPDFILCSHGVFVGLELKRKNGRLSDIQIYKMERIQESRGSYIVATPDNWEVVKEYLTYLDEGGKIERKRRSFERKIIEKNGLGHHKHDLRPGQFV